MKKIILFLVLLAYTNSLFAGVNEDLIEACKKGDLAAVQKAIDGGADVNFKDAVGWTPLGCSFFWPEITKLLLEKKADPNGGNIPTLINAAGQGSYEVMQLLINAGADPNKAWIVDSTGSLQKLLDEEKAKGKSANKYMVKAYEKALSDAKNSKPNALYPIQSVVNRTLCKECLDLLIDKGAKTDVINATTEGNLLDDLAMSALPPADWIENNKVQVGGWEKMGFTVPDWYKNPDASKLGPIDGMVKDLVKAGVNINAVDKLKTLRCFHH